MTESFNCVSCSAPLEFEGTMIQKRRYCGGTAIAPLKLFSSSEDASFTGKALKIGEINQRIQDGNKIGAIKVFRETFGVGLAEVRDAVERMERGESVDISGIRISS